MKEGKQLPGATNSWLYLESLTPEGEGYYAVEVGNDLVWLDQIGVFPLTQRPLVLASIPDLKTTPGASFLWTNRVTGVDVFDSDH